MLVYVWSREFPNAQINIYGLVTLKVCLRYMQLQIIAGCFFLLCMRLGVRVIILTSMLISTLHVLIVFSGILSSMGDAWFRCHFWFPSYARSNGNHCRASILLFDCFASTCNGKDLIKDSKIGVSLNYFVLLLGKVYLSVCNSNLQVLNVLSSLKISSTRVPLSRQALLLSFLLHQEVIASRLFIHSD